MTILELQKRLQKLYEENGDIDVHILNDNNEVDGSDFRNIFDVYIEGEIPNDTVIIT